MRRRSLWSLVVLKKENAIKIEIVKATKCSYRLYYFNCSSCYNEIKTRATYLKTHSGLCISCSAKITIKTAQIKNRLRPYEAKYNILKQKCPETDLTYDDYLEFTKIPNCHYCEKTMNWEPYQTNNMGFWLDRMDNNIGHLKGNLVVCCGDCNRTKRDLFSYNEFMLLAPVLKQIRLNKEVNNLTG